MRRSRAGGRRRAVPWATAFVGVTCVAACGAQSEPSAREYPLELAAGAPDRAEAPTELRRGPLAAGRYVTSRFSPQLSFTLGPGWTLDAANRDFLILFRGDPMLENLIFQNLGENTVVFEPPLASGALNEAVESEREEDLADELIQRARPTPASFAEYLTSLEHFEVDSAEPVIIDGHAGTRVQGRIADLTSLPGTCLGRPGPCLWVYGLPGPKKFFTGVSMAEERFTVIDHPGGQLLIWAEATAGADVADLDQVVAAMLASLNIE